MQADVEQLRAPAQSIEDRELEVMEQREPLDADRRRPRAARAALGAEVDAATRPRSAAAEAEIDAEIAGRAGGRATSSRPASTAALVERLRAAAARTPRAPASARLVGTTCQGCHLTIPPTEAEQIASAGRQPVAHCDNCGAILVRDPVDVDPVTTTRRRLLRRRLARESGPGRDRRGRARSVDHAADPPRRGERAHRRRPPTTSPSTRRSSPGSRRRGDVPGAHGGRARPTRCS